MFCYKRGIGKKDTLKNIDFLLSNDNKDILTSLSANFAAFRPYNGLYINNSNVLIENVFEEIKLKDKIYKMYQLESKSKSINCNECITNIDLNKNQIEYDIDGGVNYKKRLYFISDILCLDYEVFNNLNYNINFKAIPLVTYRKLYDMKTSQYIKFNQRKLKNGTMINISITEDINLYIKSNEFEFEKNAKFLNGVTHNSIIDQNVLVEDLYTPGDFTVKVKKGEKKLIHICFGLYDFNIQNIDFTNEYNNMLENIKNSSISIPEEFIEQKDLKILLDKFSIKDKFVNTLPYDKYASIDIIEKNVNTEESLNILIDNLKAIDGMYIVFERYKEASSQLINIRRYIKEIECQNRQDEKIMKKVVLLKLWYIEIVNRLLEKQDFLSNVYLDPIKEIIYEILDDKNIKIALGSLENICLTYNAVNIYEKILNLLNKKDEKINNVGIYILNVMKENYFNSSNNMFKKYIDDLSYDVFPEMIYTLSLSYPCFTETTSIKILDIIFKELYTPYGLRKYKKSDNVNDSLKVYPEYMAYFVKANLMQNGITDVSKKISYNLVKELIQEISKKINCGVNKVYDLKADIDTMPADLLANTEICRLYQMLT